MKIELVKIDDLELDPHNARKHNEKNLKAIAGSLEQLGRVCYMMEFDPKYVDVIIARWEKLTGEQAQLIEG